MIAKINKNRFLPNQLEFYLQKNVTKIKKKKEKLTKILKLDYIYRRCADSFDTLFDPKDGGNGPSGQETSFISHEWTLSLSPSSSSFSLHSKQLSIQNRDANLTSRKLIPQRCATSGFKGWQPWWDLIRRERRSVGAPRRRGERGG